MTTTNNSIDANQTLGTGSSPTFAALTLTSQLTVANGGTGATSITANSLILGNGTGAFTALGAATNGQIPIGSTSSAPSLATLTAGANISITNGAGSITIAVTGVQTFAWTNVSGTSASMAANNGYTANNAGLVTLTLPSTAAVGDEVIVAGFGSGGWTIAQGTSQIIHFGSAATTTTSGTLASTNQYDGVTLRCVVANTTFVVTSAQGNLAYT